MSNFKLNKKNALSDTRSNLFDLHEKKLEYFKNEKKHLNTYIKELENYTEQLKNKNDDYLLKNKISELENRINNIKSDREQTQYLLDFLTIVNKNDYLNYINGENDFHKDCNALTPNKVVMKDTQAIEEKNMDLFVNTQKNTIKRDMYNDYVRTFYPTLKQIDIPKKEVICEICKLSLFIYDSKNGNEICTNCGLTNHILSDETNQLFNENIEQLNIFNYKRHNHFQECLNQLQAKENTTIPPRILEDLASEFKKYNITNPKIITPSLVKNYLKKLKYNKYYEHIPTIINEFCGIDAPKLNPELEEQLKIMFDEIQIPFEKYSKIVSPNRKNFLNYNYIFYKMCELLNRDEFLNCFPLLKSREKLYEHDLIWKGICTDLRWEFIPSI